MSAFAELGLAEALLKSLESLGFSNPTPIQQEAIPQLLNGVDLLAAAQTGTGKTAAFSVLDDSRDLHQLRGQIFKIQNAHVVATFHPAYLALNPMEKALAWQDLLGLRALLEMPQ